jgi:hypothetical protein
MSVFDREDREKEEVVTLLKEQLAAEAELISSRSAATTWTPSSRTPSGSKNAIDA